ncbi:MAG: hypothetical protein EZS28_038072, partial [Streblomastix strix]
LSQITLKEAGIASVPLSEQYQVEEMLIHNMINQQNFIQVVESDKRKLIEQENAIRQQESNLLKYQLAISELMSMGFEKWQAEVAIQAGKGRIEVAVAYLVDGTPEQAVHSLPHCIYNHTSIDENGIVAENLHCEFFRFDNSGQIKQEKVTFQDIFD